MKYIILSLFSKFGRGRGGYYHDSMNVLFCCCSGQSLYLDPQLRINSGRRVELWCIMDGNLDILLLAPSCGRDLLSTVS